ncbi:hypothetical protein BK816_04580 [Boudabousia tangfeifanii]|uniref:PIP synthase n=1 Tax=Boudabousia tangfeifanii TaxID=1912795 RepID=A0A1D9MK50_9ACTO|nr:CDP-alcohol phosphatidyltransferase family protein [Boudabousia tangfeifanii]AOZ72662.1 hypothetical protein BK816_04580 [Boudabousia tangfeifanii]
MIGNYGRNLERIIFTPPAKVLAKLGITPNQVTLASAVITWGLAISLIPTGHTILAPIMLTIFLVGDAMDGTLARLTTGPTKFGGFYDSTLDRITDGVVFASFALYSFYQLPMSANQSAILWLSLGCTIAAFSVSYARSAGRVAGVDPKQGIAERTDRLIVGLLSFFLVGLTAQPLWLTIGLGIVFLASTVTVIQRILAVKRMLAKKS